MNKKFYTSVVLVLLTLIVFASVAVAAGISAENPAPQTVPSDHLGENTAFEVDGYYVTINGKHYAMNPTLLPLIAEDTADFAKAMNPTMLPDEVLNK